MENKTDLTICFSGGLDSIISYHYALNQKCNPLCIWVDMEQEYSSKEYKSMIKNKNKFSDLMPSIEIIKIQNLMPILKERLSNQIIPSRNVLLATIGAMFNSRVWINALDGEQLGKERDKSVRFFNDTTRLLTFTNNFFQEKTIIGSPFAFMTKAETIRWAIQYELPLEFMFNTSSCYHPTKDKCGECLTCYKRYTAFLLNDIEEPGYDFNPLHSDYAKELDIEIPKAYENKDFSRFTFKRVQEYMKLKEKLSGK